MKVKQKSVLKNKVRTIYIAVLSLLDLFQSVGLSNPAKTSLQVIEWTNDV